MKKMEFDKSDAPQEKGAKILSYVRGLIKDASNNDEEWFLINRWVHARLNLDERAEKRKIKNQLYKEDPTCHFCKMIFTTRKGVHLHRLEKRGYHKNTCVLACGDCHQSAHIA